MPIGAHNRRVTHQRPDDQPDASGGQDRRWKTVGRPWVKAVPTAGNEALIANTLQAAQPWRIEMRFRDVRTSDRFLADWIPDGKQLGIRSVADPDGRRSDLVLLCETEPLEPQ